MTNTTALTKSNRQNADKAIIKRKPAEVGKSTNRDNGVTCSSETKPNAKSTASNEQVSKKNHFTLPLTVKTKQSLVKKKQDIQNETNKDKNKFLDKCKKELGLLVNNESFRKENRNLNLNKSKIGSPNHKLTEYFSDLKVNERIKDTDDKQVKVEKVQKEEYKNLTEKNAKNLTSGKKLRQLRAKNNPESLNHKVTEYFHVRRSERKYTKKIIDEKQIDLENKVLNGTEDGLKIKEFEDKGRGIVTTKEFYKGDFVIEYIGDLINGSVAKRREIQYAKNKNIGCYMYYFKHKNVQYCVDATKESGKLGRLINHSRKGNLLSRIIEINQTPHLVLFAKTDIPIGTEILYDYGDRSRESVQNHPWLTL